MLYPFYAILHVYLCALLFLQIFYTSMGTNQGTCLGYNLCIKHLVSLLIPT